MKRRPLYDSDYLELHNERPIRELTKRSGRVPWHKISHGVAIYRDCLVRVTGQELNLALDH